MEGMVLLVTGSTGIAQATAELAVGRGAKVFVVSRTEEHCRGLAGRLEAAGGSCGWWAGDLALGGVAEAAVGACVARFGRLDALYNVAGISGRKFGDGPLHNCSEEGWDTTLSANLRSLFLANRAALRRMMGQPRGAQGQRGAILNMASVLGFFPEPEHFATHAYAASKAAILGLTRSMASYYAAHGIRVNAIAPGLVRTPMARRAAEDEQILEAIKRKQPLCEGMLEAEDVARASLFLLGGESRAVTGELMVVDGGWSVR